jgi:hypothetical protein
MPYSGPKDSKIPKNVPSNKKAQWVKVWNSAYASCTEEGGTAKNCETKAFKMANGVIKNAKEKREVMTKGLFGALSELFGNMKTAISSFQERAVSMNSIGEAAWDKFYNQGAYLNSIYFDDGTLFGVASKGGKLFRATIDVDDSNGDVEVGELQEVIINFAPVTRATFRKTKDGKVQMLSISATSVINKDGEIDSRDLFDSMVDYMERTKNSIPRTFFHAGQEFTSGDIIWMGRDDNVLVTLTEFNDSELAKREIKAREKDPNDWGDSIEYDPVGEADIIEAEDGITIPVYRAGIPIAVSTLPAESACSLYADKFYVKRQEVKRMSLEKRQRDALIKMFGGDEKAVDEWLNAHVSAVNREIADTGQVTRASDDAAGDEPGEEEPVETEAAPEEEADEEEETPAEESAEEPVAETTDILEFTPEMAQQTADTVMASNIFTEFRDSVLASVKEVVDGLATLSTTVADLQAASVARAKDIDALKKVDSAKKKEWLEDVPRNVTRRVTFRPSEDAATDAKKPSMKETAEATLATIKN